MESLILKVKDKVIINELTSICEIIYISDILNVIGVKIDKNKIDLLKSNSNIISLEVNNGMLF